MVSVETLVRVLYREKKLSGNLVRIYGIELIFLLIYNLSSELHEQLVEQLCRWNLINYY